MEEPLLVFNAGHLFHTLSQAVTDEYGNILLPQTLIYENVTHFPLNKIRFQVDLLHRQYHLSPLIKDKAAQLLALHQQNHSLLFNSATVRLNAVEPRPDGVTFIVSQAHYFDYIGTNYSMDAQLEGWPTSLRNSIHPDKHLCLLEESLLANHIGLGVLLFTTDNFLILPVRSMHGVNGRHGEISPSVSGATDYQRDISDVLTEGDVTNWIMGELVEELNLTPDYIDYAHFYFLGVTRELLRGGKPEMFFSARLTITRSQVEERFHTAEDRSENSGLLWMEVPHPSSIAAEQDLSKLHESVLCLMSQHAERLSLPVLTNLVLWYRYVQGLYRPKS